MGQRPKFTDRSFDTVCHVAPELVVVGNGGGDMYRTFFEC